MPESLRARLRARHALLARIRAFFDDAGSLEVQTPSIVRSPGVDAHLDAIAVTLHPSAGADAEPRWLTTSPEYHMKRLLAAGSGPIHQLAPAWRDGERGRLHEPEFTMLEWYVPGLDDAGLMDQTEALVRDVAGALNEGRLQTSEGACSTETPFERLTFQQAFLTHAGVDPDLEDERRLGLLLRAGGHRPPKDTNREQLVDLLLALVVQPKLGLDRPTFLTEWPADRAALARTRTAADGRTVAARFELYARGVELCNGYHELADATEQRARIDAENARRVALGKSASPVDDAFLAALDAGLPDCAGNALGVDRLLMLLTGATDLSQVTAFRLED
jgi:elongation factor P--(R)-beta-lysine ligase